jgi:hypothetical protein
MRYLRTNTAVIVSVGPFYDKTDGVTPETALTITNERISLTADTDAGSAPTFILDNITGATSGTANDLNYITGQDNGMMQIELAAADVNRLGRMRLTITDAANHCPVIEDFMVLPANVYDAMVLGSDLLMIDVDSWNNTLVPSTEAGGQGTIRTGTAGGIASQSITLAAEAAPGVDFFKGDFVEILTATTGAGQEKQCTTSTNANPPVLTLDSPFAVTPTGTITYRVFGGVLGTTLADIGTQMNTTLGTYDVPTKTELDTMQAAIAALLPAALVGGRIDASVGAMAANVVTAAAIAADAITAAKLAADAITEIQSGLATAAALGTVDDFLDTEVASILAAVDTEIAAIKAKTDQLTFTVANMLDANVQVVNDVPVGGTGAVGDEWGPA